MGTPAHCLLNKVSDCRASNQPACHSFGHRAVRQGRDSWNLKMAAASADMLAALGRCFDFAQHKLCFLMAAYRWHSTTKCGRAPKPLWA